MRVLTALALAALLALSGGCVRKFDSARTLAEALQAARQGDPHGWELARQKVASCIEHGDRSPVALDFYALCLTRLGQTDQAIIAAEKALKANPDGFLANYTYGKLLLDRSEAKAALTPLHKAAQLRPTHPDALLLAALAAAKADDPLARYYFRELSKHEAFKDQPQLYNEWALWQARQGSVDEAINLLNQAKAMPGFPPAVLLNLAVTYENFSFLSPKNRREMARRNYVAYLLAAQRQNPDKCKAVQQRLRQLALSAS